MRFDHVVTIQREGLYVTARTGGAQARDRDAVNGGDRSDYPYGHLTRPLRQRGLLCTVDFGLSDYIVRAELPDGSAFVISPPQEPPTDHPAGYPESWLVTRGHPENSALHEVVYDSAADGPHARSGGSVNALLAAIGTRLDQLGVPHPERNTADAILHRAGFVPFAPHLSGLHRLPSGITDPAEQRQAVTRAVDMLQAEGFVLGCDDDLLDADLPVRRDHPTPLGDPIGRLTGSISQAGHTSAAVAALSELTAPADGVLDRVIEALEEAAAWWEGLGAPADPLYADKLRRIADHVALSAMEIRSLRNTLADRHTTHPTRGHDPAPPEQEDVRRRIRAATSPSPHRPPTPPPPPPPAASTTPPAQGGAPDHTPNAGPRR